MTNLIIILLSVVITLLAQLFVTITYDKYKKVLTKKELSGFEVAKKILEKHGLSDIYVVETKGNLTDHYDPKRNTIRLSSDIFHGTSVASAAVAAHECGHAIQYKDNYNFIKIRNSLVPFVNFGSNMGYVIIFISWFTGSMKLFWMGIALIALILLFQLITLPVEFDASKRAKQELRELNILDEVEYSGASMTLFAAALTYVASVLTAILEIARLILISRNDD